MTIHPLPVSVYIAAVVAGCTSAVIGYSGHMPPWPQYVRDNSVVLSFDQVTRAIFFVFCFLDVFFTMQKSYLFVLLFILLVNGYYFYIKPDVSGYCTLVPFV